MPTPQEIRKIRLENDHKEMLHLRGDIIQWKPLRGNPPYIEEYEITVNVRTICSVNSRGKPSYRDSNVVHLSIPADYPRAAPDVIMLTKPPPYHPNWFTEGRWCYGKWNPTESLGDYVIRMVKTLQYDTYITNEGSPANRDAGEWYIANRNSGLFPCDNKTLPDPTGAFSSSGAFEIKKVAPAPNVPFQIKRK
jgi:ubiquitin-protein ligase